MSFNKDIEIAWLKTEIIPKLLKQQQIIENFQNNDVGNFQILDCNIKVVGVEEAFMLTTCYRAAIVYDFKGIKNKLNFFVKKTPEVSQEVFDSINFKALYTNEILAYEKIMPALQEFAKIDLNVGKIYYSILGSNFATVITEDFTSQEWQVSQEKVNLSLQHILLAVKYLAKFHAIGFAWRLKKPKEFQVLTQQLKESRYDSEVHPNWAIFIRESKKRALEATCKYEPSVEENFLENLNNLMKDPLQYAKHRVQPREPLFTLCHGDYLRNNVAFKYSKTDAGQPFDIMMFDLQTLRVSSPMVDLSIFLSLSSYASVRYKHFKEMFTLYSDTLRDTYKELMPGTEPEYLSHNVLLKEYIKFLPYSISICSAFLMTLVQPSLETPQERLMAQPTEKEINEEVLTRGGEEVDRELAHQIKELYELNLINEANVFEDF